MNIKRLEAGGRTVPTIGPARLSAAQQREWIGMQRTVLAAAAWLLVASPALAQREDQVFLTKGAPVRGTIPDGGMTRDRVTIDSATTPRPIEVHEITRITFKDEPGDLNLARTQALQKNYSQALVDLKKLDGQKFERAYVRQDIEFYRALCLCRLALNEGGDKKAATDAMYAFVSKAPQSYHFYEAAEILGDVAMAAGNYAEAARYYGPVATAPWDDYQIKANNATGRALLGEKKFDQALEKFQAVIKSPLETPDALKQ